MNHGHLSWLNPKLRWKNSWALYLKTSRQQICNKCTVSGCGTNKQKGWWGNANRSLNWGSKCFQSVFVIESVFSRQCLPLRCYASTETLTVSNVLLPCGIMQQRVFKMDVKALASQNISWSGPFRWAIFTLWLWFNCMSDVFTLLLFLLYTDICALLPWKHEDCDSRSPFVARHHPEWVSLQTGLL